jgi:hypothetical protein
MTRKKRFPSHGTMLFFCISNWRVRMERVKK